MKLNHKYFFHYLGTASYEFYEDKIVYIYKNLKSESSWAYSFLKIKSFRNHKNSTDIWVYSSWIIVALVALSFILKYTDSPSFLKLFVSFLILFLILISFFFQFKKREYIGFYDKDDQCLFSIRLDKSTETREFISKLKDQINRDS